MEEFDYKGYLIEQTSNGYFAVNHYVFISLDEAMNWIDEQNEFIEEEPKLHKYLFFYVDRATDRSFEEYIEAKNYHEAERKLRRQCDVYHIADCYMIE